MQRMRKFLILVLSVLFTIFTTTAVWSFDCSNVSELPVALKTAEIKKGVVSLDSSVTEIFLMLGVGNFLRGITVHDLDTLRKYQAAPVAENIRIVGSFFAPSVEEIKRALGESSGIVFIHEMHEPLREQLSRFARVEKLNFNDLNDLYTNICAIGRLVRREAEANKIVSNIHDQIKIISRKLARIPKSHRKRVMRIMGRATSDTIYTPSAGSFQNLLIKLAGGIPPAFGKNEPIVPVTLKQWQSFNPQVIYGCGGDAELVKAFLLKPGWKNVDAVKNGNIYFFPCDLTCRISVNTGLFVQWLSATIYEDEFLKRENLVERERIVARRRLDTPLNLPYIASAEILDAIVWDFLHKTLVISFTEPMDIISTLEGPRKAVTVVGNSYSPPPCWNMYHRLSFETTRKHMYDVLKLSPEKTSMLFTGANMDNLSVQKVEEDGFVVYALVTAGVRGNAQRMSKDRGNFKEPGTINIILLTNRYLTPRAMTRAIITATEAKTAALQDLDIRSTQNPLAWQATGTGTDEIIVVSGRGPEANLTGGHSKLGELIARAVYAGVLDAVRKQNGITKNRTVFERLNERKLELFGLIKPRRCGQAYDRRKLLSKVQATLLKPRYAALIEIAFAISDAYDRGLLHDLSLFESLCDSVKWELSGKNQLQIPKAQKVPSFADLPVPLGMALDAIINSE
ncbi:MAG: adenosylcobinamide amidohydrolase [Deltaproteobacteria bacterium]|nr:adenosylcobinamide amidohydrolase [Deltaproteobacteria bacterium]MBW2068697.1 adenosylcobinamide amidohydrolase [Deltaproteobacteria bacterium]